MRARALPHAVPRWVVDDVVGPGAVHLHAARIHAEAESASMVVPAVDLDEDPVRRRLIVASREGRENPGGMRVEHAHAHVQGFVIVRDASDGLERGDRAWMREAAHEVSGDGRGAPDGFVESSIDHRCCAGDAHGTHGAQRQRFRDGGETGETARSRGGAARCIAPGAIAYASIASAMHVRSEMIDRCCTDFLGVWIRRKLGGGRTEAEALNRRAVGLRSGAPVCGSERQPIVRCRSLH